MTDNSEDNNDNNNLLISKSLLSISLNDCAKLNDKIEALKMDEQYQYPQQIDNLEKIDNLNANDWYNNLITIIMFILFAINDKLVKFMKKYENVFQKELRKNWLRITISMIVVVIQFIWFSSYFIQIDYYDQQHNNQQQLVQLELIAPQQPKLSSSFNCFKTYHSIIIDNFDENDNYDKRIFNLNSSLSSHKYYYDNVQFYQRQNQKYQQTKSKSKQELGQWLSFIFNRFIFIIKLASIMIIMELLRLTDTILNIIIIDQSNSMKSNKNGDFDDENRQNIHNNNNNNHKSFIDLSYIERNRGYK